MNYTKIISPNDLKRAINKAIKGNKDIIYHIGTYIAYNFYFSYHIIPDSDNEIENERTYSDFRFCYPELYEKVEERVKIVFRKMIGDFDN